MSDVMVVPTIEYTIWVGMEEQDRGLTHHAHEVEKVCQEYVNDVGLCITITPTKYIYSNGSELGVRIGLINYPRFPSKKDELEEKALELARRLMKALGQKRVSVVGPDETFMLRNEEKIQ